MAIQFLNNVNADSGVLYVDAVNNKVGIGTTSPESALEVSGEIDANGGDGYRIETKPFANWGSDLLTLGDWDGEGYETRFMGSSSSEVMRVTDTKVGIGTTSPGAKLDVVSGDIRLGTNATYFRVRDTASAQPRVLGMNASNITYVGPIDSYAGGGIVYGVSSNVAYHGFYGGGSEKVRITSAGNVGIGTTSPSRALQVIGTDGAAKFYYNSSFTNAQYSVVDVGMMTSGTAANGFGPKITFRMGGNGYDGYAAGTIGTIRNGADNTHNLNFATSDGGSMTTKMTITNDGNVGIGTTAPGAKLEVNGNSRFVGEMQFFQGSTSNKYLHIYQSSNLTFINTGTSGETIYFGAPSSNTTNLYIQGTATIASIANATTDTDKFLVSQAGAVQYRTGAQLASDIGAVTGGPFLPLSGGTLTGDLSIPEYLYHAGDSNTYLRFQGDSIELYTGGWKVFGNTTLKYGALYGDGSLRVYATQAGGYVNGDLEVDGVIKGEQYLRLADTAGTNQFSIRAESTYGTLDNGSKTFNYIASNHLFLVGVSEKMRINSSGNVGIGTTSPGEKLEVNGTVKATATTDAYKGYIKQNVISYGAEKVESSNYYFTTYNTTSTVTTAQPYNRIVAAYNGRVKKVYIRHAGASTPTATAVNFKKHTNGVTSSTVYSATVANTASTNMTAYYEFGNNDFTFNAGDLIGLLYQTTDAFGTASKTMGGVAVTITLEYNIT